MTKKRAFTLVELLVVVGIIAAMATLSVGSYFAAVRGMADRGAISTATSILSLAEARANIDLTPTIVYFYNEIIEQGDEDTEMVAAGVAVAVRKAGRLTGVVGSELCDEFADLDVTYDLAKGHNVKGDTFRLYKMDSAKKDMQYSLVYSTVVESPVGINDKYIVEKPQQRNFKKKSDDSQEDPNDIISYAFKKASGGNASWQVGDAYGYEFARVQLPNNYIFGSASDVPDASASSSRIKTAKVIVCKPTKWGSGSGLDDSVEIRTRRPSDSGKQFSREVGKTKDEMKDV